MKLVPLTNISGAKLRIVEARLVFEPGQTKKVHPATVQHPAVQKYIGGLLKQGTQETIAKAEPKAPVAPPAAPLVVNPQVSQPNAGNEEETPLVDETTVDDTEVIKVPVENEVPVEDEVPVDEDENVNDNDSAVEESGNLREVFLSAPGITDKNIETVLETFDSIELLAAAEEDDLTSCGISKGYVKRVIDWAESELN